MLQEPSSRPQPQYWIQFLDPWVQDVEPILGCNFASLIERERAQLLPGLALDKSVSHDWTRFKVPFIQELSGTHSHWYFLKSIAGTNTNGRRTGVQIGGALR